MTHAPGPPARSAFTVKTSLKAHPSRALDPDLVRRDARNGRKAKDGNGKGPEGVRLDTFLDTLLEVTSQSSQ